MENHPIPQDITGFQFKLIGKMTIRQFIYLAIGAVIAWFVFFILEPPTFIKFPIAIASFGIGAAIAFIPIDGRPMDTMLRNFFGALTSPTQFIYQKRELSGTNNSISGSTQLSTGPTYSPIAKQPISPTVTISPKNSEPLNIVEQTMPIQPTQTPQFVQPPVNVAIPSPQPIPQEVAPEPELTEPEPEKAQEVAPTPPPAPVEEPSNKDRNDLEEMLAESQRQKEALEKQILEMQAKQESNSKPKVKPIIAKQKEANQRVRKIPNNMASSVGIPDIPEAPNLITGIVKDSRGNPIQNIIIEVKDEDANAVRAFKTNSFGKFASATSLSNGNYTLAFEDSQEKHRFDEVALELIGKSVMPLEIISIDSREELRRELFN